MGSVHSQTTYLLVVLFAYRYLGESTPLLAQMGYDCSSINPSNGRLFTSQPFLSTSPFSLLAGEGES